MSSAHADAVGRMIEAINERDPARRRSLIEQSFTPDCAYTDPDDEVQGHDALDALFERLQRQAPPELRFSLSGPLDAHHRQARFTWQFGARGSADPVATGGDVAVFYDGRIHRLYAFFDKA
ncbi:MULTISPECIES: nuclear transport factor 2 family protein [unclassified Nonomuraea]|uniref:nuclear transport factor 2 family protein n=1 Tax=unclassified Nonomuraea TaxID=2593643 RepID=UPI0034047FB6